MALGVDDYLARDGNEDINGYTGEGSIPELVEISTVTAVPAPTLRRRQAPRRLQKMAIENIPYVLFVAQRWDVSCERKIG